MQVRSDLRTREVVGTVEMDWVASPETGVERKMLERDGDEVARATSLVRYLPGSHFGCRSGQATGRPLCHKLVVQSSTFS